jgi:hypothetical protein
MVGGDRSCESGWCGLVITSLSPPCLCSLCDPSLLLGGATAVTRIPVWGAPGASQTPHLRIKAGHSSSSVLSSQLSSPPRHALVCAWRVIAAGATLLSCPFLHSLPCRWHKTSKGKLDSRPHCCEFKNILLPKF